MKTMGIRELKAHMSEVIREVQGGETVEITRYGEVVALLVPVKRQHSKAEIRATLTSIDALAAEIARYASERTDVSEIISNTRR